MKKIGKQKSMTSITASFKDKDESNNNFITSSRSSKPDTDITLPICNLENSSLYGICQDT